MTKLALWIITFWLSGSASAQDVAGTWQGAVKSSDATRELRLVIKISKSDDSGALKAVTYSIDQGGLMLTATTIALEDSILKITIAGIGSTYEGKLSADGNSITGTWTQGSRTGPLNLNRATPETAWAIAEPVDSRLAIEWRLQSQFRLTKASADKATIVTAGTVIVLRKDGLRLFTLNHRYPPGNTYANGVIKESFLGKTTPNGAARTFVAGEKLWLTRILFERGNDGVALEFLSDPFGDDRYWGTLKSRIRKARFPLRTTS